MGKMKYIKIYVSFNKFLIMKALRIGIIMLILIVSLSAVSAAEDIDNGLSDNSLKENVLNHNNLNTNDLRDNNLNTNDLSKNSLNTNDLSKDSLNTNDLSDKDLSDNGFKENTINQNDHDNLKNKENALKDSPKTFTDLQNQITNASNLLELTDDYKYNNETDNLTMTILKVNFTINGNGHTIDGDHKSDIFEIYGANITLKNLKIINADARRDSTIFLGQNSELETNNVTFINDSSDSRVIFILNSKYTSNNDRFIDCTSEDSGVINSYNSDISINNGYFESSEQLNWGFIESLGNSSISVYNSTFANTTSKYTTAIKGDRETIIKNSKFINLHANLTAGAIGLKEMEKAEIDNCTFLNISSEKNGGAIFIDGYSKGSTMPVAISNSTFVDCYSEFGGAVMSLGAQLTLENDNFTNNMALFDGGALYASLSTLVISNTTFDNNSAVFDDERGAFGGAIFSDSSALNMGDDSRLINNHAQTGGAVYAYDSNYYIIENVFSNNTNQEKELEDIFTDFDGPTTVIENNTYSGNDSLCLNNERYESIIAIPGMNITVIDNEINVTDIPKKFDLRDWGWVTPVKNQGSMGSCWAFGTAGAMESAILRFLGIEMDISENNMQDSSLQYYRYGTVGMNEGGSYTVGPSYALSWFGIFPSDYDVYDELGKISPIIATNESIHLQDVIYLPLRQNSTDNDIIKQALLKYGGVAVTYYAEQSAPGLNEETSAQYSQANTTNHRVVIVGWDDDYSKDNFLITPPGDGAWIIKNSWGTDVGDNGYYYISYYDTTFATQAPCAAFPIINTVIYNKNYQYDIGGLYDYTDEGNVCMNVFEALEDDFIAGVGTYFNDTGVDYSVEIYVNEELKLVQNGTSPFGGFHTIQLDSYVPIKEGDQFAVVLTSNSIPFIANGRQHYVENTSMVYINDTWIDITLEDKVCPIKVYTTDEDKKGEPSRASTRIDCKNMTTFAVAKADGRVGEYFKVTLKDENGTILANKPIKIGFNGKVYDRTTDENGSARLQINLGYKGTYTFAIGFLGDDDYTGAFEVAKITVKVQSPKLTASNKSYKANAKTKTLSATFKTANGKAVSGKKISFTLNGKTYTASTDSKGLATVKVSLNKKGSYSFTVKFAGDNTFAAVSKKAQLKLK